VRPEAGVYEFLINDYPCLQRSGREWNREFILTPRLHLNIGVQIFLGGFRTAPLKVKPFSSVHLLYQIKYALIIIYVSPEETNKPEPKLLVRLKINPHNILSTTKMLTGLTRLLRVCSSQNHCFIALL